MFLGLGDERWQKRLCDEAPHDEADRGRPYFFPVFSESDEVSGGDQVADVGIEVARSELLHQLGK